VFVNPVKKNKVKKKLKIIINTAHTDLDWNYYINQLDSDGTLTFVGVPPSPLGIYAGSLMAKRKRIMASPIGGRAIMTDMLRIAADHQIHPIIEIFPKDKANEAIEKVN